MNINEIYKFCPLCGEKLHQIGFANYVCANMICNQAYGSVAEEEIEGEIKYVKFTLTHYELKEKE